MSKTFFFYDLETSGLNARSDRIMQFGGQRTDKDLNPIGEPVNVLVKLNDDTLPSPEATMVTGITPQATQADGYTEAEFSKLLINDIFMPDTITVGFNNIRFDDEFIRHLLWRNFYDPYEWAWKDGRSRWDMLDVVRMTRALRPKGINWPTDEKGKPTNRLELLSKQNGIEHENAHDALADVEALIAIARLIKQEQPQLYDYLLLMRDKKEVQKLVNLDDKQPFVYVSGRYDAAYDKATVAFPLTSAPNKNVLVYDLRHDPEPFLGLSQNELRVRLFAPWEARQAKGFVPVPVKQLQYNRCPAIAPVGVLEQADSWTRLSLTKDKIEAHKKLLLSRPDFAENIRSVFETREAFQPAADPESALYDGFIQDPKDRIRIEAVRNASLDQLSDFHPGFSDERLDELLLHYKARNFPSSLSKDEQDAWQAWRASRLRSQITAYLASLKKLSVERSESAHYLLEELQLWAENIIPIEDY